MLWEGRGQQGFATMFGRSEKYQLLARFKDTTRYRPHPSTTGNITSPSEGLPSILDDPLGGTGKVNNPHVVVLCNKPQIKDMGMVMLRSELEARRQYNWL